MKHIILTTVSLFFIIILNAQSQIIITNIHINGNKVTQDEIILRELSFDINNAFQSSELDKKIKESEENLINLKLFNFVKINKEIKNNRVYITIKVVERWYIWPYPIFEIYDRNFNTWWEKFKSSNYSDFSRLNYGVFFNWENFRGRNEMLKLKIRRGFKEHYLLFYESPYFNKQKR